MNASQFEKVINILPPNKAIMIRGPHGVGKSEITEEILKKSGYHVIVVFVSQAVDAGDIIGLPSKLIRADGIEMTTYALPSWWIKAKENGSKVALIFDEYNRSPKEVRQCCMQVCLKGELNGFLLPQGTRFFACINPADTGDYDVEELDEAQADRWATYDFCPSWEEWLEYAKKTNHHWLVQEFIAEHKDHLWAHIKEDGKYVLKKSMDGILPSPRSWTSVSDTLNLEEKKSIDEKRKIIWKTQEGLEDITLAISGLVGWEIAEVFKNFIRKNGAGVKAKDVIFNWSNELIPQIKKLNTPEQSVFLKSVVDFIEEDYNKNGDLDIAKHTSNFMAFIKILDADVAAGYITKILNSIDKKPKWLSAYKKANNGFQSMLIDILALQEKF